MMTFQETFSEPIGQGVWEFILMTILYFVIAGLMYRLYYIVKKDKWMHRKNQQKFPTNESMWFEIKYSISTLIIFGGIGFATAWAYTKGWTRIYTDYSEYGTLYFIFSIIAIVFIHDTYFYWGHRFMHLKAVYPLVHQIHHRSINPTPWATFSFHPIEAVIEGGIVPLTVLVLPIHPWAIFIFFLWMIISNVFGHLGYETNPAGFTKKKSTAWLNTPTHHNMHHSHFDYNYGLYFNLWDKWMGTNHDKYLETFDKVTAKKKLKDS